MVDSPSGKLATGDAKRIARLRAQLRKVGAQVEVDYAPEEMKLESWPSDKLSLDKRTCRNCGATLFYVVPGKTSEEEIVAFAKTAKLPNASQIEADKWIHPGVYCPNGCGAVIVEIEHPDLYLNEE
jgi:hypothetical protein